MRIPWYIVIPLSLLVFGGGLWLGVRDRDFSTPPNDLDITDSVEQWKIKHPSLPPRQHTLPNPPPTTPPTEQQSTSLSAQLPLGNLTTSPALDHYRQHPHPSSTLFIQLAIALESQQSHTHALLAWERVIDSSSPDTNRAETAHKAIHQLRGKLPIWTADAKESTALTLHISTPTQWENAISTHRDTLTQSILQSSSYQVVPTIKIETTTQHEGFPPPPLRMWLSGTKETPQLTFLIPPSDTSPSHLKKALYLALYKIIQNQFSQLSQLSPDASLQPPADLASADSPEQALTTYLTRLHWRTLIRSLSPPQTESAPSAIIIEETHSEEE